MNLNMSNNNKIFCFFRQFLVFAYVPRGSRDAVCSAPCCCVAVASTFALQGCGLAAAQSQSSSTSSSCSTSLCPA